MPYSSVDNGGYIVNDGHWGGYVTLAMNPVTAVPLPVPTYHARVSADADYHTRAADEWSVFEGIFMETSIPWDNDGQLIWPKSAMDGDSIVHIVSKHDGAMGIFYSRLKYNPATEMFDMTNPDGAPELITDMAPFISADITVSSDGERVVVCQPVKRTHLREGLLDQDNDKDMLFWSNDDRGRNWDWGLENATNLTQFQGPNLDLFPDTAAVNQDTFRLWLESQVYLDDDHVLHAAFSASEYFYIQDSGYIFSQIFYWNEEDQYFIRLADGSFWNNQGASLGVNNVLVQRPCLYKDPETGWLWCVFQQIGVPGDTTANGEARDVNVDGRPNAEIFITASPVGEFGRGEEMNGKLWFKPINITNSRDDRVAVPAGECQNERDPSIALNNDGEYLHISYLVDMDAGMAIGTNPEGVSTDNPFVYQRIAKQELVDAFMEAEEWMSGFPMHADSTGFWEDPLNWAWEGEVPPVEMRLNLQVNYFELISTYVEPADLNAESVFGAVNALEIVYQDDGSIYIPDMINTIGNITLTEGYQLFCSDGSELVVQGTLVDDNLTYHLAPLTWNWLAYPYDHPVSIETALAEIENDVEIVMTDDGGVWIPPAVNTIGDMTPGEGYFVFVSNDVNFHYNNGAMMAVNGAVDIRDIPEVEGAPAPTGLPYAVIVRLAESLKSCNPAAIELYDGELLVGKAIILEDRDLTPVIAWGGSEERNISGFKNGRVITIKVKAADGREIAVYSNDEVAFGAGAYADVTIDAEALSLPSEFAVRQGYPNPFNPTLTIPFTLPSNGEVIVSVYNVLGQRVFETVKAYEAGYHSFIFDASQTDRELVSGIYFLQVGFNGQNRTQKIMLLK